MLILDCLNYDLISELIYPKKGLTMLVSEFYKNNVLVGNDTSIKVIEGYDDSDIKWASNKAVELLSEHPLVTDVTVTDDSISFGIAKEAIAKNYVKGIEATAIVGSRFTANSENFVVITDEDEILVFATLDEAYNLYNTKVTPTF